MIGRTQDTMRAGSAWTASLLRSSRNAVFRWGGMALLLWTCSWAGLIASNAPSSETWWSFKPVTRPALPSGPRVPSHPVDAWIHASLEAKGIQANGLATPRERVRRLYFDLIGLPPEPEVVRAFEANPTASAWTNLVDRLLASPAYGERWARHWLDVVRFAQSNGYERDGEKKFAWRYRDYVVDAFNADKPYDQFVREQIAGDEWAASLEVTGSTNALPKASRDAIVATGFLRLGVLDDEPDDKLQAEFDELDDIVSTTGAAFLGLTLGCARCHDHKFDPLTQADYYSFVAFYRSLQTAGKPTFTLDSSSYAPLAPRSRIEAWKRHQQDRVTELEQKLPQADDATKRQLKARIETIRKEEPPFEWTLAGCERQDAVPPVQVLSRGNPRSPGAVVSPAVPEILGGRPIEVKPIDGPIPSSGRRRALAEWIASPQNPLTARVIVNRVWHEHFGRGIVKSTTDFGKAGLPPTHPQLLDWLASEFMANGWSLKRLHRLILTSDTWSRSSSTLNTQGQAKDPANELLWRHALRRMDAEALRDTLLSVSGRLNPQAGGRGFFPHLSGEALAGGSRPGTDWEVQDAREQSRRSLYAYVRRTTMSPMMEAFDYSNVTSPLGERPVTTVAPQALMLMNDAFMTEQARGLAERLTREIPGGKGEASGDRRLLERRLARAFELAASRLPKPKEIASLTRFMSREQSRFMAETDALHFRPDVPDTLSIPYLDALPANKCLVGPSSGWSYHKGLWPRQYEGNRNMEEGRGPFALWQGATVSNFVWSGTWVPSPSCDVASFLFRVQPGTPEDLGYEIALSLRNESVAFLRHSTNGTRRLAETRVSETLSERVPMKIDASGARLRVWLGAPLRLVIDSVDPDPLLASGACGVRVWGASVTLDHARLTTSGSEWKWAPELDRKAAERAALEAACLLVLNLNELCYVD